jgi:2',3'-cyclic-nucleotide 2'-phosphodiesterase (5'-nucleotidase family)
LQAKVLAGRIAPSTIVNVNGTLVGVVGALTETLPTISSPGGVIIDPAIAAIVQAQVNTLIGNGASIIILISHLQNLNNELALVPQLDGVDVVIAGGGDEFLANPGVSPVYPGDVVNPLRPYPTVANDINGDSVQVVTSTGEYRYVGRLVVEFDDFGNFVAVNPISNPVCVLSNTIDAVNGVVEDPACVTDVINPINAYISGLASHVIATTEVPLDGRRPSVRTIETNEGDLFADALLWEGQRRAADFGVCTPNVAFQNGGGMRKDAIIPVGNVTELNTYEIAAFDNVVSITPNVPASQFKEMLEASVRLAPAQSGGFLQVAGFKYFFESFRTAQTLDANFNVVTPGQRVRDVVLNDGTVLVRCGEVVPGAPDVCIATNAFTANNGDAIPFRNLPKTIVGVSYQQALYNYITEPTGLNGLITGAYYPSTPGEYRIVQGTFSETFANANSAADFSATATTEALTDLHGGYSLNFFAPSTPTSVTGSFTRTRPVTAGIDYNLPSAYAVGRYYTFTTTSNGSTGSIVTLCFKTCEFPGVLGTPTTADLVGVRTTDNGATWFIQEPSAVNDLGGGVYCVEFSDVDGVDGFWGLGLRDRVLPVELTSFDADVINGEVALAWTTASELNIARFELTRNGEKLAEVAAQNNASGANYSYTDSPVAGEYTYELSEVTLNGEHNVLGSVTVELSDNVVVNEYRLGEAYPNPFNPQTNIDFVIPNAEYVTLNVFNPLGQIVATLVNDQREAGSYSVQFDASNLTSGIYFYRLEAGSFSAMRKMMLVK